MSNSRRSFLRGAALTTLAMSMPFKNELMAMASKSNAFGLQLWSVKQALAKDPLAVLKQLSDKGYKKIESFEGAKGMFWGMKNTEFKKVMDDLGMNMVSSHCNDTGDLVSFERKAAAAGEIGLKYLICAFKGPQKSLDNFKKFTDEFNACGEIAKKHGLRFAYHNHDYSFKAMEGIVPQDLMMDGTNPDLVDFEMDMYWTVAAGVDPIAYMDKHPNRFKLVHVKDLTKTATGHESCVIGKGTIDYKSLLPKVAKRGVQHMIVEQEAYTGTNELDAARDNAAYLKTLKW
ncbi:MAG: sugar phosphate isomerase/epimerase family protein [Sediminibacterium sp.]